MNEFINELVEISTRKKTFLEKIALATKIQFEAIEKNDLNELDKLIDEKQKYIDEINILDNDFELIFEKIKDISGLSKLGDVLKSNDDLFIGLKTKIADILKVIEEIKNIENINSKKLSEQKNEIGKKMRELSKGKLAQKSYLGEPMVPPNPAFIDKKK